ncbi:hypothetical protein P154DRAFT_21948 [Amniculicola lignicola CBS 123094]|uniref:BZIP domain-containing protein n=1 Tax=Amniculicola lignicola CBS 123094 TaxID=1392246 RepID=A0A6A5WSW3_9PLEO|nr:hypothetical protein P154DRAFT_21948 [Amniculicola lignicola CBS 123094]
MSGYNGRRGPNVSQYVANLNQVPAQGLDLLAEQPVNLEEDLAVFANSEFIDWEGSAGDLNLDFDLDANTRRPNRGDTSAIPTASAPAASEPKMDFLNSMNTTDFQFSDFTGFSGSIVDQSLPTLSHPQPTAYPVQATYASPTSSVSSPIDFGFDHQSKKRKSDAIDSSIAGAGDELARNAAEEDKRRRNTAASARFRIKKKQREQALEKTAKEMTDRVSVLETRIQQLETENTWLKGLITEKNGGKASTSDLSAMLKKHTEERSTGNRTDGVGTAAKDGKAKA